jgi:hypothetical protein
LVRVPLTRDEGIREMGFRIIENKLEGFCHDPSYEEKRK